MPNFAPWVKWSAKEGIEKKLNQEKKVFIKGILFQVEFFQDALYNFIYF